MVVIFVRSWETQVLNVGWSMCCLVIFFHYLASSYDFVAPNFQPPMNVLQLPNLCWVALSNNPFLAGISDETEYDLQVIEDPILEQDHWPILGQGAGGITRKVNWNGRWVAVKTFAGELTSDGSPQDERAISVAAAKSFAGSQQQQQQHPCTISLLGQTQTTNALIMEYLDGYTALAGPPSFETCSRDVYGPLELNWNQTVWIVQGLLEVLIQLHSKGICHGDFYAHNILLSSSGDNVKLSDFGAAFFYDTTAPYADWIQKIELRAFGILVAELYDLLLNRCSDQLQQQNYTVLMDLAKSCNDPTIRTFQQLYEGYSKLLVQRNVYKA